MARKDYAPMWQSLGMDLEAHEELLNVLGQAYGDIFLSQENRPEGMQYLDDVLSDIHGLLSFRPLEAVMSGRV